MRVLVIGGTRSGKSAYAESLLSSDASVTYVATGATSDEELASRIARHQLRRSTRWTTVETSGVRSAIERAAGPVLVDSVGRWVAARMDEEGLWDDGSLDPLTREAIGWFEPGPGNQVGRDIVVVAEDVGGGVLAEDRGTRRWVDCVGEVTQALAVLADRMVLVVAGRPLDLPASGQTEQSGPPEQPDPPEEPAGARGVHGAALVPDGSLDLASNVVSDRPARHVQQAMARVNEATYPDPAPALVAASSLVGLTDDHVVLLAGASEAFWLLPHALRPRRAAVVHPYATTAEAALRACEVEVTRVPRDAADGWRLRPDRVPEDADLVVLGNPNNPTGTLDDPSDIVSLCRPGRTLVVDETFMDFVVDGRSSLAGRVDLPGLIVIRSVTAMWSVPGVRAGYLLADPAVVQQLRRHQQPWPVSSRAIAAIVAAADNESWRTETAEGVARRRRAMVRRLERIDRVVVHEGAANFVLVEVESGPAVHRALLARGIAVRPSTFPLLPPRFLRVAVRDAQAVEQLAVALEEIV